ADYAVTDLGSAGTHDVLTVTDDHSTGVDEDGHPFDLLSNSTDDQTATPTWTHVGHHHDGNDGMRWLQSDYSSDGGARTTSHSWGTLNGVPFEDSSTQTDGSTPRSFTLSGNSDTIDPKVLPDTYPFARPATADFPIYYGYTGSILGPEGGSIGSVVGRG